MARCRVVINSSAAVRLMNGAAVQSDLLERAERIRSRAASMGGDYEADVQTGRTRAHAMVKTRGAHAARANSKKNSLLKSLDAGRG